MISTEEELQKDNVFHHKYSADIFIDQKRKINELLSIQNNLTKKHSACQSTDNIIVSAKSKNKKQNNNQQESSKFELSPFKSKDLTVDLQEIDCWEYSSFDYEIIDSEDVPVLNAPFWPYTELDKQKKEKDGVDLRNIILKTSCLFNLER